MNILHLKLQGCRFIFRLVVIDAVNTVYAVDEVATVDAVPWW